MYPWSSSTSQQSIPTAAATTTTTPNNNNSGDTTNYNHPIRYGSAPSSVFETAVDSVFGNRSDNNINCYGSGGGCGSADSSAVASSSNTTAINRNNTNDHQYRQAESVSNLQRSCGWRDMMNNNSGGGGFRTGTTTTAANSGNGMSGAVATRMGGGGGGGSSTPNLTRHSSSPAGFLHQLTSDIGFSFTKGVEGYNNNNSNNRRGGASAGGQKLSRLSSQLSFSGGNPADSLSQISEADIDGMNVSHHEDHIGRKRSSSTGFSINAWQDGSTSFVISTPSNKRANKNGAAINDDILNDLSAIDSQFCLPHTTLEMGNIDTMLQIPHDSVPCKIRAKRGCATHPRSIAERERRTRISGKLKKLQDLVPNMDKQTSYADMLDLAVEHIKGLQSQIQKLNEEVDRCTCGCKEKL